MIRTPLVAAAALLALPLSACMTDGYADRHGYGYARPAPAGTTYSSRALGDNDYIYRDADGRYYCKRDDGTTGTIVGAIAGGVLGNIIAPGGSKTLGTILGAGGGALAGRAIDRSDIHCQ